MRDEKLLETLTQLWGVAGYESAVREAIEKEAGPYADEMWTDAVGNLIVLKKGTGENRKKIMYAAHMDQIGFMLRNLFRNSLHRLNIQPKRQSRLYLMKRAVVFFISDWESLDHTLIL